MTQALATAISHQYRADHLNEVLKGLRCSPQKTLPCKYLYDEYGSSLYDAITQADEYYLTRTEIGILQRFVDQIVQSIGKNAFIVEYGSGSSIKIQTLLERLSGTVGYAPVDISGDHLFKTSEQFMQQYPMLSVIPIHADYHHPFNLPQQLQDHDNCVAFFPGSTIGNFEPQQAVQFLRSVRSTLNNKGKLLIGFDLIKPIALLEAAYNDREGITAAFNKNILTHINRELNANFESEHFSHQAIYNPNKQRIEMHLVSNRQQQVRVAGEEFNFQLGESIHTENSYKYSLQQFADIAAQAGWQAVRQWQDDQSWFSVQLLRPR